MDRLATMLVAIFGIIISILLISAIVFIVYLIFFDRKQKMHSILRNYPLLGRVRYFLEKIGPELRQYWFNSDDEGKPFSRKEYEHIVKSSKYKRDAIGFGSTRDFEQEGYYIKNAMFTKLSEEMEMDSDVVTMTNRYLLIRDPLFTQREEKLETDKSFAYLLRDEDAVVIGPETKHPFVAKGLVGM